MPEKSYGCSETAELDEHTLKIQHLNDQFRKTLTGGQVFITAGVQALTPEQQSGAMNAIFAFDAFTPDNDPYGLHDFGEVVVDDIRV